MMTIVVQIDRLKKCKSTLFLLLLVSVGLKGQNHSNRFFSSGSEIVVDVLPENDIYYSHKCDQGITIYDLAEVFQINEEKLLRENRMNPKNPNNDGKIVKVPILKTIIAQIVPKNTDNRANIKVKYKVKKGDNLYRIAKEYFDTDVNVLLAINNKKSKDVKIGEELLVGWIAIKDRPLKPTKVKTDNSNNETVSNLNKVKKEQATKESLVTKVVNLPIKTAPEVKEQENMKIVKYYLSDVIGYWDKAALNISSYYVLHNEARPGTMMDVYNPMLKTHIKAKVLGKIPVGTYASDIQIIISPSIAKDLKILDGRFKVNIKYEQ